MVTVKSFGFCDQGEVSLITLTDDAGTTVELLSYGATVRSITVPDQHGTPTDVCLGYETLESYQGNSAYVGAIIGRNANRLEGASFTLGGETFPVTPNEGENQLHGGAVGFDKKLWKHSNQGNTVTFHLISADMEEGYPGEVFTKVTYSLTTPGQLDIDYFAVTDRDTVVNLTNHCYFNLSGHQSGSVADHIVSVKADFYTPNAAGNIATGEVLSVEGTPLDLRQPVRLGDRMDDPLLAGTRGYDHNFVVNPQSAEPIATAYSPETGILLETFSDRPGLQLYTAGFFGQQTGKDGTAYDNGHAFCFEAQYFPNAINHPHFPSPVLGVDDTYRQHTSYRFSVAGVK